MKSSQWQTRHRMPSSRRPSVLAGLLLGALASAGLGLGTAAVAGPLSDITRREAPPPPEPLEKDRSKPEAEAPTTELPSVVVKSKRQQEEETVRQKLEKAIKPKPDKPLEKDLNKADESMKNNASWASDPDSYKDHPGDPTTKFIPAPGDETDGCGADITKGCKPRR